MLMTIEKARQNVTTDMANAVLADKLQALELLIRKYTNNNFQQRYIRCKADVINGLFICTNTVPFKVGDTIQVSESKMNSGLYTVKEIEGITFRVNEDTIDEELILCTKIVYPMDVQMGAINMLKWDLENRSKVGIQSETISRHSVTYFNMDGINSSIGYPTSLVGFLKPYIKARF